MFDEVLQRLADLHPQAAAIFCDYEGESIAFAAGSHDPYEVQVTGAQLAAWVISLQRIARASGQSERLSLVCAARARTLLVEALPGGYYVTLAVPAAAPWPLLRRRLGESAAALAREL